MGRTLAAWRLSSNLDAAAWVGQILEFLEGQARNLGFDRVTLHAQEYVKSFYAAHGYREVGEMFLEVDIPHREMVKDL